MKIGIFGGAFNPIHYGHLRSAEDVLERLSLDSICFIPSGTPAFSKPRMVSALHRYEMVRIAIEDNSRFSLSDVEVSRGGRSYSVDTLKKLGDNDRDIYFIVGIDAFIDLPGWKEPDTLVKLANLVVISRPGYLFSDTVSSPYLKKVPRRVFREIDRGVTDIFSCEISLLSAGMNVKYLLPDSVKSYIISHRLYTVSEHGKGEQ
jgi:nicotinate-nucleotide adenylyltransferase